MSASALRDVGRAHRVRGEGARRRPDDVQRAQAAVRRERLPELLPNARALERQPVRVGREPLHPVEDGHWPLEPGSLVLRTSHPIALKAAPEVWP